MRCPSQVWMSCWKTSWVFRFWATTMIGRLGNKEDRRTARNGWAAGLTASKDKASPPSTHSRRLCTAGVEAAAENKSPVAKTDGFMPTNKTGPGWPRIQGWLFTDFLSQIFFPWRWVFTTFLFSPLSQEEGSTKVRCAPARSPRGQPSLLAHGEATANAEGF